jgi:hypothetical protein
MTGSKHPQPLGAPDDPLQLVERARLKEAASAVDVVARPVRQRVHRLILAGVGKRR